MERSIEGGRWTATFRPRKLVRFFGTGFLAVWMCVWVAGEATVVGILLATLGVPAGSELLRLLGALGHSLAPDLMGHIAWREIPMPQTAGGLTLPFLVSWLTVWTIAGLMAAFQLLRLNGSEDRVLWDGTGVESVRRAGPFRSRRSWRVEKVEHVSLSRADRALMLHTPRATHVLTEWGSRAERQAVRDEIRRVLGSPWREETASAGAEVPAGWVTSPAGDGGTLLVRDPAARRGRAAAAWIATTAIAVGTWVAFGSAFQSGSLGPAQAALAILALIALAACAAGSAWLSFGGSEFIVRKGEIEIRHGLLAGGSNTTLKPLRLSVEHSTDGDGDDWFELQARSGNERRTLERCLDESERLLQLGHWISERSGVALDLGRGVEEDADDEGEAHAA